MLIKTKLTNLDCMFESCSSLKNIDELKYLNVKGIKNFSCMFYGCSSLSNIKALENWDVSNSETFESFTIYTSQFFKALIFDKDEHS